MSDQVLNTAKVTTFVYLLFIIPHVFTDKFLIYHQDYKDNKGLCLAALYVEEEYQLNLKRSCPVDNVAWKWERLTGGLLRNVLYQRCLALFINPNLGLPKVGLATCDSHDQLQRWSCTHGLDLAVQNVNVEEFCLESYLYNEHMTVRVSADLQDVCLKSQWFVYTQTPGAARKGICDIELKAFTPSNSMLTVAGTNDVGKPCIFPYIREGKESWGCFESPGSSMICPTTSDFDRNPQKWGVCLKKYQGSFSRWTRPFTCTKPCNGGSLIKQRFCLFAPCVGQLEGIPGDEKCNTQTCDNGVVLTKGGNSHDFSTYLVPLKGNVIIGSCHFPFVVDGVNKQECITDFRRNLPWCSLTEDFDRDSKWGYCLNEHIGMWSTWRIVGSCSRSCGTGHTVMIRSCRFPPCNGSEITVGAECNTKPCDECFNGNGKEYKGYINVANDGTICQRWDQHSPHPHASTTKLQYPELEENFCRNPGGIESRPFCYRNSNEGPARMYCDIPRCVTDVIQHSIPYVIPLEVSSINETGKCVFPFLYENFWFDACTKLNDKTTGREKCGIGAGRYAYCPASYRGTWSDFKFVGDCSKKCGGGFSIKLRRCIFPPCRGSAVLEEKSVSCNTHSCVPNYPGIASCFTGTGFSYLGNISRTINASDCMSWNSSNGYYTNSFLSKGISKLIGNHCRNPAPSIYASPWCYVTKSHWEYCDMVRCATAESEILTIPLTKDSSLTRCVFPFQGPYNRTHMECIPTKWNRNVSFCSTNRTKVWSTYLRPKEIIDIAFKDGTYSICPTATKGTWSSWVDDKCSVACGGGHVVRRRVCRHPPCPINGTISRKPCNTNTCLSCLKGNGSTYRGNVSVTYLNQPCVKWADMEAHASTPYKPSLRPELQENFCRNPGGHETLPWCFIDLTGKMSFCEVPHCSEHFNLQTIPYTIPEEGKSMSARPCHFPFTLYSEYYFGCFTYHSAAYYCSLVEKLEDNPTTWARCPLIYMGKWTAWNKTTTCNAWCGGGKFLWIRECLYPPCHGTKIKLEGICNTRPCLWKPKLINTVDCFIGEGQDYVGDVDIVLSGQKCQRWSSTQPHPHRYGVGGGGISLNHAKCRNPSPYGYRHAPWCFVDNINTRWEYCDIVRCPTHLGGINTIGGPANNRPCAFPFLSTGEIHHECILAPISQSQLGKQSGGAQLYFCATVQDSDQNPSNKRSVDWGICPRVNSGLVSPWTVWEAGEICTKQCLGGKIRYRNYCRLKPCQTRNDMKNNGTCNHQPCQNCVEDDGVNFRGTQYNNNCKQWNWIFHEKTNPLESSAYTRMDVLGDLKHNFCRNPKPERYKQPFCFKQRENGELQTHICNIPRCSPTHDIVTVEGDEENRGKYCVFPFKANGELKESCQRYSNSDARHYCGTSRGNHDVRDEKTIGFCSKTSIGTWSSWQSTGKCTKVCGSGKIINRRHCRYKPCFGNSIKHTGSCNTFVCDKRETCYDVQSSGSEFNSNVEVYRQKLGCQSWLNDLDHDRLAFLYPYLDFSTVGCRNPDRTFARPYCITNRPGQRIEFAYCDVPPCPGTAEGPILVETRRTQHRQSIYSPCVFPFSFKGNTYDSCTKETNPDGQPVNKTWCGTIAIVDTQLEEWGYCPTKSQGLWSSWSPAETQCTLGCSVLRRRRCLNPTCYGKLWDFELESCYNCKLYHWTSWGQWSNCEQCMQIKLRSRACKKRESVVNNKYCVGVGNVVGPCGAPSSPQCKLFHASGFETIPDSKTKTESNVVKNAGQRLRMHISVNIIIQLSFVFFAGENFCASDILFRMIC